MWRVIDSHLEDVKRQSIAKLQRASVKPLCHQRRLRKRMCISTSSALVQTVWLLLREDLFEIVNLIQYRRAETTILID